MGASLTADSWLPWIPAVSGSKVAGVRVPATYDHAPAPGPPTPVPPVRPPEQARSVRSACS